MKLGDNLNEMKKWIILVLVGVLAFWGLNNLELIFDVLGNIYRVFSPFILGFVLAYILNIPMMKVEYLLKKAIPDKYEDKYSGIIRLVSIILSILLLVLIIAFVGFLLIPELIENIESLMNNIPAFIESSKDWVINLLDKYPDVQREIEVMFAESGNVSGIVSSIFTYIINGIVGFVSGFVGGFVYIFTGIIFAIYMLCQKEYLVDGIKRLVYAFTDKRKANKIMDISKLTNKTFSKFISGQCVEAVILGTIMFVVCLLGRFPYALIIGVLTAITALVPIFGAFIACGVGAVLIAITNPLQALIFVAVFVIIQQIEGNVIYPKVVGKSVGLSPLWTLLAITVGGNLFGVVGMIIGLPLASVVYAIGKESIKKKLDKKDIEIV
ncbi:MAG: AI-2E family transporter [Bacilli bacterium]|nr:AI-2E family transporter [Bacilli bacterium]